MSPTIYEIVYTAFLLIFAVASFGFSIIFVERLFRKNKQSIPLRNMNEKERKAFAFLLH